MTPERTTIAAIRYGYGLSPTIAAPDGPEALLAGLQAPDAMASRWPYQDFESQMRDGLALRKIKRERKQNIDGADAAYKLAIKKLVKVRQRDLVTGFARPIEATDGFRDRLTRFWADHFTVTSNKIGGLVSVSGFVEGAIRPNISGKFGDMLKAAATHPLMLVYLDQLRSIGPNSVIGQRREAGLNENLAREILELHTLGVGAGYDQDDVREFAELLTGMQFTNAKGFEFRPQMAEPGAETVLGRTYGGRKIARLSDILEALDDIALHPSTGQHIARKLVVQFISDKPDPALVSHIAEAYAASDGNLTKCYEALLEHPRAWSGFGEKVKQPFDFMASSMRALQVDPAALLKLTRRDTRLYLRAPLIVMGQDYQNAPGPDGWPEDAAHWITPQGLAARIQWAMLAASLWGGGRRDPSAFVATTLAELASPAVVRAARFAESRTEAIGLVLASPEFNRR